MVLQRIRQYVDVHVPSYRELCRTLRITPFVTGIASGILLYIKLILEYS